MSRTIDVTDLPEPIVEAIETMISAFRGQSEPTEPPPPLEPEWLKGKWVLPESFFEPLPDDLLDLFEGKSDSDNFGVPAT